MTTVPFGTHAPADAMRNAVGPELKPYQLCGDAWRVGQHYGIHVYQGERPVATFFLPEDALRCVSSVNTNRACLSPHVNGDTQSAKTDAIIFAMCKAHDREDAAQKGEPSPWENGGHEDHDFVQERFFAMREAFDVAREASREAALLDALKEAENQIVQLYRMINPHANDGAGNRMADQDSAVQKARALLAEVQP